VTADATTEAEDIALAEELAFNPCAIALEEIERGSTKTADFCMISWRGFGGYAELKSPRDDWLDDRLREAEPGEEVGGIRKDPVFNRLARHILDAVEQFDAVNPARLSPNVLVIVNHDPATRQEDLWQLLGLLDLDEEGKPLPGVLHIGKGKLATEHARIDLYLWIDAHTSKVGVPVFSESDAEHAASLKELFRSIIDAQKVR
jgi:hypothetical protein